MWIEIFPGVWIFDPNAEPEDRWIVDASDLPY